MEYITISGGAYYTTAGNRATNYPSGMTFEGGETKLIRDILRINKLGTNLWIPFVSCKIAQPTQDTFPAYLPVGAEWQMRFKLTPDSEYTEYFTFTRTA